MERTFRGYEERGRKEYEKILRSYYHRSNLKFRWAEGQYDRWDVLTDVSSPTRQRDAVEPPMKRYIVEIKRRDYPWGEFEDWFLEVDKKNKILEAYEKTPPDGLPIDSAHYTCIYPNRYLATWDLTELNYDDLEEKERWMNSKTAKSRKKKEKKSVYMLPTSKAKIVLSY